MKARRKELLGEITSSIEYWQDLVGLEVLGDVSRLMEAASPRVTQAELARRLGSSQPYVSKVLNGTANFTLQTLIKIALALEAVLHVRMTRPEEVVQVRAAEDVVRSLEPARGSIMIASTFVAELESQAEPAIGFGEYAGLRSRRLPACVAEA